MDIQQNVSLTTYSTMGLGGQAAYLTIISDKNQITEAYNWALQKQLPVIMIGGGSNIIWRDNGFAGLVMVNQIRGYNEFVEDEFNTYLTIGAGEIWDEIVQRSVEAGLTGIEALSLIPGTAGGTPIQNVGAYGQEISQTLATIEAYDTKNGQFINIPASDCDFSYRNSRFKTYDRNRFFITGLTLHLIKGSPLPPFYGALQTYFEQNKITNITPDQLRAAVIAIRTAKLPDPAVIKNTGSFFGNPVIRHDQYIGLTETYDPIPHWETSQGLVKLSAAWLIQQAGFGDYHDPTTGMATWPYQPLVLINEKAKTTADLLAFKQKIVEVIEQKFGITLIQEPELLP